jgi:hypothetical protein
MSTSTNHGDGKDADAKRMIIMEQVAMYMAALPCPPMPLLITGEDYDEDGEPKKTPKKSYCNSHDFIASLLLNAMVLGNQALNSQRKSKQIELTDKLLKQMSTMKSGAKDVDKAYSYFSEFTAGYICALASIDVGVTFLPLIDVEQHDNVHKACCSWNRAQAILSKEEPVANMEGKSYRDLLQMHCERFQEEDLQSHTNNGETDDSGIAVITPPFLATPQCIGMNADPSPMENSKILVKN